MRYRNLFLGGSDRNSRQNCILPSFRGRQQRARRNESPQFSR